MSAEDYMPEGGLAWADEHETDQSAEEALHRAARPTTGDVPPLFNGASGLTANAEARRYVYGVLAMALASDLENLEGWVFGGMANCDDRRRARIQAVKVLAELRRKQASR